MLGSQRRSVVLYLDQLWESRRTDLTQAAEMIRPPVVLRHPSESAVVWPPSFLFRFCHSFHYRHLYLALFRPALGTLNLKIKPLVLILAFSLGNHVTSLGFSFAICKMWESE